ncbi:acetyl-CoA carboxylase biotin carboxyl carrier protein [Streptomyces acidiscabies]|uniref:acetyl-CoA carboxylase biotin carboxyl carrier protein n=1 Tax=Streptomyces acidiscabies TaxID=42234 RepID=UPI00067C52CD|nr:biotin/lipoyl-containing protein [Streptomyces acidiscabies]
MTALRTAAVEGEAVVGGEGADLLERVRDAVAVLLAGLPGTPARLRVRAGGVELELDWPAAPPAPAPVPVPGGPAPTPAPALVPAANPAGGVSVTASTVGTFFRSPEPGADPFVQVGDQVKGGQQVAIIEVMKLMIPVEADRDAVITEVLVDDGQSVEYGQPLFALGPVS